MSKSKETVGKELKAIEEVIRSLSDLDPEAINRVLKYSLDRLGVSFSIPLATSDRKKESTPSLKDNNSVQDIFSLKELKRPSKAIEMAALVGYYLSECAPQEDRKSEFGVIDAQKYFKQAKFKLPPKISLTLNNAKNSGYLDSAGHGKFKLNPVGYNLVVHNLPSSKK